MMKWRCWDDDDDEVVTVGKFGPSIWHCLGVVWRCQIIMDDMEMFVMPQSHPSLMPQSPQSRPRPQSGLQSHWHPPATNMLSPGSGLRAPGSANQSVRQKSMPSRLSWENTLIDFQIGQVNLRHVYLSEDFKTKYINCLSLIWFNISV